MRCGLPEKNLLYVLNEDTSDIARCLLLNYGEDEPLQLSMESSGDGKYYIFVIIKMQLISLYFKTIRYLRPYLSILFFIIKFTCYYMQYIYPQQQYIINECPSFGSSWLFHIVGRAPVMKWKSGLI